MKWLFLVHELQGIMSSNRVKLWRNTKKTGAILYRDSAYVLPYSKENLESFQWILSEIKAFKGQASIFISQTTDTIEDEELKMLFLQNSDAEYNKILEKIGILQSRFNNMSESSLLNSKLLKKLQKELEQLIDQIQDINNTDFFNSSLSAQVKQELSVLQKAFSTNIPFDSADKPIIKYKIKDFQRKKWATRKDIHIDRLCSAWLIKRFIDKKAQFEFAPEDLLPKEAILFDVYNCEFGHRGEDCTYETLLKSFQIKDKVLLNIAEIVHDIDLKDKKFNRTEAKGIDHIVRSLSKHIGNDHKVSEIGFVLMDSLYNYYKSVMN